MISTASFSTTVNVQSESQWLNLAHDSTQHFNPNCRPKIQTPRCTSSMSFLGPQSLQYFLAARNTPRRSKSCVAHCARSLTMASATTFTLFPLLPDEIQLKILSFALRVPRLVEVRLHEGKFYSSPSPILQVCKKLRIEGLKASGLVKLNRQNARIKRLPRRIYCNPEHDTLLIHQTLLHTTPSITDISSPVQRLAILCCGLQFKPEHLKSISKLRLVEPLQLATEYRSWDNSVGKGAATLVECPRVYSWESSEEMSGPRRWYKDVKWNGMANGSAGGAKLPDECVMPDIRPMLLSREG